MLIPLLFLTSNLIPSEQVSAHPVYFSPNFTAQELITEVNNLRVAENLVPYKTNPILMTIAQTHADYLASAGVMTHFDASGLPPFQRAINAGYSVAGDLSQGGLFFENIGSGSELTTSGVVGVWHADAKDLQTMLATDPQDVGAGVTVAGGITYYVLDVGSATSDSVTATSTSLSGTQSVAVITSTPLEDGTVYHLVQANEALWSIALGYNTTVEELKRLNHLSTNDIFEGQKLLIKKAEAKITATPTVPPTATFGIPTSTATHPVTPTATSTATPLPVPPTSRQSGGLVVGIIVLIALTVAGVGAWLGSKKST